MIRRLQRIRSAATDPFHNLALEEELLRRGDPEACVLYLWQNRHTVVIGRNQDAFRECHVRELEADGGFLARRLSGGGTVYHDLGNLNFTFLLPTEDYDEHRQTQVLLTALRALGLQAERSGRNDLLLDGRKFSGHAYYHSGGRSYHHGTLMVAVDRGPLERYLSVSPAKLASRGVSSVRSRVCNLTEFRPDLRIPELADALEEAFSREYGLPVEELREEELDAASITERTARFSDTAWRYGAPQELPATAEARFSWGTVRVGYAAAGGKITAAAVHSDGMDADWLEAVPGLLVGCPLRRDALLARLGDTQPARDLCSLFPETASAAEPRTDDESAKEGLL